MIDTVMSDDSPQDGEGPGSATENEPESPRTGTTVPPSAARSVPFLLGALLILGVILVLYAAQDFVLPVALAFVLKLIFHPFVRLLERAHVPKVVGALTALCVLLAGMAAMAVLLSAPTANWTSELAAAWQKLQQNSAFLHQFAAHLQGPLRQAELESAAIC